MSEEQAVAEAVPNTAQPVAVDPALLNKTCHPDADLIRQCRR